MDTKRKRLPKTERDTQDKTPEEGRFRQVMSTEQRNAQKTFDSLCDNACRYLERNEPLPVTLDAILLGYIGFISIGDIIVDEHFKALKEHVNACENAELLMPSVYAAISDVTTFEAVNDAYPEMDKVSAWEE